MDVPRPPRPPRQPPGPGRKSGGGLRGGEGPKGPRRPPTNGKKPPREPPDTLPGKGDPDEWSLPPGVLGILNENGDDDKRVLELVDRDSWKAELPMMLMPLLELPVKSVQFFLKTGTPSCDSFKSCASACRKIQRRHVHKAKLDDIAYNFLLGEDGRIYEGRGWEYQGFAARRGDTLNIAFIGDHTAEDIDVDFLDRALAFIYIAMAEEKIIDDYETKYYSYPYRDRRLRHV